MRHPRAYRIGKLWSYVVQLLEQVPWILVIVACLTLGLAPFTPEPHLWEKLQMLTTGTLTRPIDIFDLALHGSPFFIAFIKLLASLTSSRDGSGRDGSIRDGSGRDSSSPGGPSR